MPEKIALVVAKSAYGIKVEQDGDWWNWSKPDFRGEPFDTEVAKGDRVKIEYTEADNGKVYISKIERFDGAAPAVPEAPPDGVTDKDRLIVRQVCIKAACAALAVSSLETEEKAGRITYLAGVLEDWCYR